MNRNTIAINVLSRWVPDTCEDAIFAVSEAQRVLAEGLRAGNVRLATWLVERLEGALSAEHDGIVKQLLPLVPDLDAAVRLDGELASRCIALARRLGLEELFATACASARKALVTAVPEVGALRVRVDRSGRATVKARGR